MSAPRSPGLRLAAWLAAGVLRVLGATWRLEVRGHDPFAPGALEPGEFERGASGPATREPRGAGRPPVGVCWHEAALVHAFAQRGRGLAILVSRSRDGERVAALLDALGFGEAVRGSSSRGGTAAARAAADRAGRGDAVGVLVDGPRGPARAAKPGAARLARLAALPLVAFGCAARPAIRFGSWDRTLLPLPFARVVVVCGEPFEAPADSAAGALQARLDQAQAEAERALAPRR